MNKVIIELPQFMDVTIKARNLQDAIQKLLSLQIARKPKTPVSIQEFKGIAKFDVTLNKEDWYRQ